MTEARLQPSIGLHTHAPLPLSDLKNRWVLLIWIVSVVLLLDIGSKTLVVAAHLHGGEAWAWMERHGLKFAVNPKHSILSNFADYSVYGLESSDTKGNDQTTSWVVSGQFWDSVGSILVLFILGRRVKRHDSRSRKIAFTLALFGLGIVFSLLGPLVNIKPLIPFWLFVVVRLTSSTVFLIWFYNILRTRMLILATAISLAGTLGNFSNALFFVEGVVDFIPAGGYLVNIADVAIYASRVIFITWLAFRALILLIDNFGEKPKFAIDWLCSKLDLRYAD